MKRMQSALLLTVTAAVSISLVTGYAFAQGHSIIRTVSPGLFHNTVSPAVSLESAQKTATAAVPSDCTLLLSNWDDDDFEYEFKYVTKDGTKQYQIKVSSITGEMKEAEMDVLNATKTSTVSITEEDAKKAVLALYPDATILTCILETDDGMKNYELTLTRGTYTGEIDVNPQTGVVTQIDWKLTPNATKVQPAVPLPAPQFVTENKGSTASTLTPAQATAYIKAFAPNAVVYEMKLDSDDGILQYEGECKVLSQTYEFEMNAQTGQILKWEQEDDD